MNTELNTAPHLPRPFTRPAWLQQLQWDADPVGYMETAARSYPDIFKANVVGFGGGLVFVNQPQAIQDILTRDATIGSRTGLYTAPGDLNRILTPILGDSSDRKSTRLNSSHITPSRMPSSA